jgi:HSP20 family protein
MIMTNGEMNIAPSTVIPAVDIVETPASYIVTLDIPGAEKNNIKASIENNTLTVSASIAKYFPDEKEKEAAREYRREFSLANDVETSSVDARFERGVLTVTLNKKQQFLPKHITIN